jgi:hypothetical protein
MKNENEISLDGFFNGVEMEGQGFVFGSMEIGEFEVGF